VLRGQGEFAFQLAVSGSVPDTPRAKLRYQICNDITNICYPPQTVQVPLQLAAAQNLAGLQTDAALSAPAPASFRERLAVLFRQSTHNLFFAIALVFVAGLIASATP
jgi:hypothetical protein